MKLIQLNVYCLLYVFKYCSEEDLINLCYANQYLYNVIERYIFSSKAKDLLMCGYKSFQYPLKRNLDKLTNLERLIVARNWVNGIYSERQYCHHAKMFPTKLFLEKDYLFVTHAKYLRKYRRCNQNGFELRLEQEITTSSNDDISDFKKKRNTIFAGRTSGYTFICECNGETTEQSMHHPSEYLQCVDFSSDLYVTSSDKCCKLWKYDSEHGQTYFDFAMELPHAFKCLELSSNGHILTGGLYTDIGRKALRCVDVVKENETVLNSNTISIYDLKLKDDHIIFTANFDSTFRMYDRRANCDVSIWEDPFDSSFYCLQHDGQYAVLCGTKYHSRVNLYDIRMTDKYVQLFFPSRTRQHTARSPVYSLACDSRYLFIATDHNLRVFDFKTNCSVQRDYNNLFNCDRISINSNR